MISGVVILLVSLISTTLAWVVGLAAGAFLTYFIYVVQFFTSLPFAWEYVGEQMWLVWVGYYFILAGVLLTIRKSELINPKSML